MFLPGAASLDKVVVHGPTPDCHLRWSHLLLHVVDAHAATSRCLLWRVSSQPVGDTGAVLLRKRTGEQGARGVGVKGKADWFVAQIDGVELDCVRA